MTLLVVEVDVAKKLSLTYDEESHIGAGFSYLAHGDVLLNPEHPPLVKLLAGAILRPLGVHETSAAAFHAAARAHPEEASELAFRYGERLLFHDNPGIHLSGMRPGADAIVTAARVPVIIFPVLLALAAWAWARAHFGRGGGLLALALVVTCPDVLGHGALVTTDVPFAAFALLAGFSLDRLVHDGRARWLGLLGLALGGALATKFSAVFLVVGLALAGAGAAALRPPVPARSVVLGGVVVAAIALVVIAAAYLGQAPLAAYRRGLGSVYAGAASDYLGLCLGRYAPRFWYYFLVAPALKLPLGTLGLLLAALVLSITVRAGRRAEILLHVPALVLLVATSVFAAPVGSRYMIPALAFLLVSAGRVAVWARASRLRQVAIGLALVANLAHMAVEHPFHASSVNALGGPAQSFYRRLDDSNQDWGQGLKALARWQRERGVPRIMLVTNLPVEGAALLAAYGVEGDIVSDTEPLFFPQTGTVYAVSAHLMSRGVLDEALTARDAFRTGREPPRLVLGGAVQPREVVGGGLLVFNLQ